MNFWSLSTGRLWIFFSLSKNMYGRILFFCWNLLFVVANAHSWWDNGWFSVKTKGRSPKICWFWCWCSCGAVYTVFVCLFSVFFVHFVYLLGRFSDVNIGYQPPLHPLQACIIHKHGHFCFYPLVSYIVPWLFIIFYVILLFFLHTYPYKHVHMLCVWFFLNCLILLMFPIFHYYYLGWKWDYKWVPKVSFHIRRREVGGVSTIHSALTWCFPALYIKTSSFSVTCLLWELRFKSLTNMFVCWTVETPWVSLDVAQSCAVAVCHEVRWDLTVSPHRSGVPRTQGAEPLPSWKKEEEKTSHGTWSISQSVSQIVNQSPATDKLSFIWEVWSNVCVVSKKNKPIFGFRTSVLLNHASISPQRVCAVFPCCSSSDARVRLQIFKDAKMLAFWMGLPDFFLHGSFCMKKKKKKLVLYTNLM